MRRPRVYVAGPINGSGRQFDNLRRALDAGTELMELGLDPFIPHLNLLWSFAQGAEVDVPRWQAWDDNWLSACDALYRLPGESPGSDHEDALARRLGIPVFYTLSSVVAWAKLRFDGGNNEVSGVRVGGGLHGSEQHRVLGPDDVPECDAGGPTYD
jgi:hypothetical protein